MKNKSLLFNAILAIALVVLYVLHFTGGNSAEAEVVENTDEVVTDSTEVALSDSLLLDSVAPSKALNFPIAYVDIDRINEEYEYIVKGRKRIEGRQIWLQKDLEKKGKELQTEYVEIMTQAEKKQITEDEARKYLMNLQDRQQQHMMNAQKSEESIAKEGQAFLDESYKNIRDFLEKNKDEFKYSYVFMHGGASTLLYANDSLDITNQLLVALNANFRAKNNKK